MSTAPHDAGPSRRAPGADWSQSPERSRQWVLSLMRWIAMNAGRRVARLLLGPIALYFMLANGAARHASRQYLALALGRPARWFDVYRHIHTFAATVLDRVYLLQPACEGIELRSQGAEVVHRHLDVGRGVFMLGAHLGSFEALRALGSHRGAKVAMVMYEDNARLINAALAAIAPHTPFAIIGLGRVGAMLKLRDWLDEGGIAGVLADRTLPVESGRSRTHRLSFLGQPAAFSDGPFRLAALLRKPVVFMAGLYHGGNCYELRVTELIDFSSDEERRDRSTEAQIERAMQAYVSLLESLCREMPYNWFNFYDFWASDATTPSPAAR